MRAVDEIQPLRKLQALKQENEQLKTQVAEFERRQQIAIQNAYADGFEAGNEDTFKLLRKRR
jgi:hypothetical protein